MRHHSSWDTSQKPALKLQVIVFPNFRFCYLFYVSFLHVQVIFWSFEPCNQLETYSGKILFTSSSSWIFSYTVFTWKITLFGFWITITSNSTILSINLRSPFSLSVQSFQRRVRIGNLYYRVHFMRQETRWWSHLFITSHLAISDPSQKTPTSVGTKKKICGRTCVWDVCVYVCICYCFSLLKSVSVMDYKILSITPSRLYYLLVRSHLY